VRPLLRTSMFHFGELSAPSPSATKGIPGSLKPSDVPQVHIGISLLACHWAPEDYGNVESAGSLAMWRLTSENGSEIVGGGWDSSQPEESTLLFCSPDGTA
jgi:hypothetical protein